MADLTNMQRKIRRYRLAYQICLAGVALSLAAELVGCALMAIASNVTLFFGAFIPFLFFLITGMVVETIWYLKLPAIAADMDHQDLGLLISLLGSAEAKTSAIQSLIRSSIVTTISKLEAADLHEHTHVQWKNLYKGLEGDDETLVLAILQLLEKKQDTEAIPCVRRLVDGEGQTTASPHIREAAHTCLSLLLIQAEKEKNSQMLLRATASSMSPDLLLRPASGIAYTTPEETARLLHPVLARDDIGNSKAHALLIST